MRLEMKTEMKKVMFSESTFEEDLEKSGVNIDNYKSVFLVPRNRKFSTVDALILPNKCLQITKQAKGHSIAATKSFLSILEKMKSFCLNKNINVEKDEIKVQDEKPFRFMFIVNDKIFDNFGSQEVQCNEDLSENYTKYIAIESRKDLKKILINIEKIVAYLSEK